MTRDEARRLLGGYATGSLSEQERKFLFDAALEDQELFDELADEHTVKELVELPGAKQRLLAALGPEKIERTRWAQPWPWAAALALATVSVSVWLLLPRTVEAPVQIAQNVEPAKGTEASQANAPTVAPTPSALSRARSQVPPEPPSPAPPASTAPLEKSDAAAEQLTVVVREESLLRTSSAEADNRAAPIPNLPALPTGNQAKASAPRALAPPPGFLAGNRPAAVAVGQAADSITVTAEASLLKAESSTVTPSTDALSYTVTADGILRIVPIRAGVLEVLAGTQTLFRSNPVVAGTSIELLIPPGAQQLRIDFAAAANTPAVAALPRQDVTGTLVLPGGTNPRVAITIPARR